MTDLLLTYYGDDLTGSTDVMEALSLRGVPTVLFIRRPTEEQRARFPEARVVGLAGTSRSETPDWMRAHLPADFEALRALGAPLCHYKVCSTFDSAPEIGSIGVAFDLGRACFGGGATPVVVGAPQLRRYTAFGHLFAGYQGEIYRIDRHPVMSRHPVTPMAEADLAIHLSRQTAARIGHVDQVRLAAPDADEAVDRAAATHDAVFLDVADRAGQLVVGRQLLRLMEAGSRFVVGSSGVEYALTEAWAEAGTIGAAPAFPSPGPVDQIAIVSGSVSPTTERQIRAAEAAGFVRIAVDPTSFFRDGGAAAVADARTAAEAALGQGRSVILHTALGPSSDVGKSFAGQEGARHAIGRGLGQLLTELVRAQSLKRAVIAGGDTSSHALREMGIFALTTCLPLPQTPGSPLCTAWSDDAAFDGLQIALKGGQVGGDDYFLRIRAGEA